MTPLPRWLTTEQARQLTGLSAWRLYELKRTGRVRATRRSDGTNRYHLDSLRDYVDSAPGKQGRRRCGWHPERLTGLAPPEDPDDPPEPPPAAPLALTLPADPPTGAARHHAPRRLPSSPDKGDPPHEHARAADAP